MTWLRIDDAMVDHPKIIGLSDGAFRLHMTALCYCARHLTDGFVPAVVPKQIGRQRFVPVLVDAGLWKKTKRGWNITDYLGYNPSREKVERERAMRHQRAKAGSAARWGDAQSNAQSNALSIDSVGAPIPIPSHPIPKYGHSHTAPSGNGNDHTHTNDLRVRAEDLDPAIVGEIERLVRCIPNGEKSMGRLVKAARDGKPQAAFSDARAAYENTRSHKRNPGAYVCGLVEKYA